VVVTSNKVERRFSRAKIILTERRSSMHPRMLENFLFLRENAIYWDASTVDEAIRRVDTTFGEEQKDNEEGEATAEEDSADEDF